MTSAIASSNGRVWRTRNFVRAYTGRALRPAEVMILVRHRELFSGRVLELGAGAGRVSGYLIDLASSYHGIDLSPRMVEHGRARYPDGTFEVRDLLDLVTFADGSFDLVFAGYNVLDVLDDVERRRVLRDIYRILARDGALVMSSHNRASSAPSSSPARVELTANPLRLAYRVVGAAASVRNRRRLAGFEREEPSHAIRNDAAHWYRLLHYYIGRDEQETQLEEAGFKLLDCLDEDGKSVRAGEPAAASSELHYVAQRLPIP